MILELFVPIRHKFLIGKYLSMIIMHHKTFKRKGECFEEYLMMCVYVLLVFKISIFKGNNLTKIISENIKRTIKY